jgi:uncharacterized membrane protein
MAQKNIKKNRQSSSLIFRAANYKLMIIGILLVAAGFASMYIENSVRGIVPIYISPILILAGYVVVIFAIIRRAGNQNSQHSPRQ